MKKEESKLKIQSEEIEALINLFMVYPISLDKILMSLIFENPEKKITYSNEGIVIEHKFTYMEIKKEKERLSKK